MGDSHALSKPKARRMGWLFGNVPSKNSLERCSLVKASDLTCLTTLDPPPLVEGHAFVYILACSDGALYIGSASDLRNRLKQHDGTNGAKFTRDHPGGRLVYFEGPFPIPMALQRQRQLKRWSRAKKLALIQHQTAVLARLSQSREQHHSNPSDALKANRRHGRNQL
jgi:putative endonuclease